MPVAFVTGSGKRRVGAAIAEYFANRGYSIAAHYRSSALEAAESVAHWRTLGVDAEAFPADLTDEAAVHSLVADVYRRFGEVDVLVNAAAIWKSKSLEEISSSDVREHFDANALGTFLVARDVGLRMAARPAGGCIVNIGDWAEVRPYRDYAAYFPSKGAVTAITRSLAVELAARNPRVRVNAILPGPVMLPAELSVAERAAAIAGTLVKREGSPENIAQAVWALVENDFICGVCLPVDGGRTLAGE